MGRRNLPAEILSSHGQSGIPHCCQLVHGGPGAENNSHSTGRCQPKNWKRYVNDVICLVHTGKAKKLQQHMNTVDPTGSIIFTRDDEENNSMPFLDAKFTRKDDGSVKSTVYRKKSTHRPILELCVPPPQTSEVRSSQNPYEEVEHLREALRVCGYPSWALNSKKKKNNNKINDRNYRSQVVIPYVEGVSERVHREYNWCTRQELWC